MGGRIYDPEIGRFLSADPITQDPNNPQSWNRYAYVFNNPWSYTDPSGYKAKKFFKRLLGAATAFMFPPLANTFWSGVISGASSAAIQGGNILKGALAGGISAQFARIAGHGTGPRTREFGTSAGMARHAFYGGLAGGINSRLHGGSFGEGFLTGGLTSAISKGFSGQNTSKQLLAGAVTGGVVAKIYGTSFTDGFFDGMATAAFVHVFNDGYHSKDVQALFDKHGVPVNQIPGGVDEPLFDKLTDEALQSFAQDFSDMLITTGNIQRIDWGIWHSAVFGVSTGTALSFGYGPIGAIAGGIGGLIATPLYHQMEYNRCGIIYKSFERSFNMHFDVTPNGMYPGVYIGTRSSLFGWHQHPTFNFGGRLFGVDPWFAGNRKVFKIE